MKYRLTIATILLFAFIACKENYPTKSEKHSILEQAKWFLGDWENRTNEGNFREIWKQVNDSSYAAESFISVGKDTVFYEKVDLIQRNDSLFYIVSVKDQNKEQPVSFYMTKATASELVFENPKHDFPTAITYTKITTDSIVAGISGMKDGKKMSESFPMHKKN